MMEELMEIVDPHFHLIDIEHNPYPWLERGARRPNIFAGRDAELREVFVAKDYQELAARQHVVKAVHVQANWDHSDPVGETGWLSKVAAEEGLPSGIVGYADLAAENIANVLEEHCQYPLIRGIRQILNWHPDSNLRFVHRANLMCDEAWLRGYALLQRFGLSFDAQIYYWQMDETLQLARRFPETQIILNHTGMPIDRSFSGLQGWQEAMKQLATASNVAVKISGLGLGQDHWNLDEIRPIVLTTIDIFGVDRCMFASDYPVEKVFVAFDDLYNGFREICSEMSSHERAKLFRSNAECFYRI